MHNYWLVARHEYRRLVVRRAFLLVTLAVPLGFVALIGLAVSVEVLRENRLPVGFVDYSGTLDESRAGELPDPGERIEVRAFQSEEAALAALRREEIQAFFVLPENYLSTLNTDLYYLEEAPSSDVWGQFDDFVRVNLVAGYPDEIGERLLDGPEVLVVDTASGREFSESAPFNFVLPFIASLIFFIATMSASGNMLHVVADEKENRTMEIMLTTLTPGQLIGGKALGLLAVSLTQLGIYTLALLAGFWIASQSIEALQQISVPWTYLGVVALFFFPAYTLISGIMIAIGGAVTELQQGQQLAGFLNFAFIAPLLFLMVLFENPAAPLYVFFTLFPTTAFLAVSLRWGLGTIPFSQLGLSWIFLTASALVAVWAATRIFRAGMLRYGQPLSMRSILEAFRRY